MKNKILLVIMSIFFLLFLFSLYNGILWLIDKYNVLKQAEQLNDVANIQKVKDNENTEIIGDTDKDKKDPYWDYIKMDLINVDFQKLKKINKSTKGWIQVKGTNINYPFVQSNDNSYYLTHAFDQSRNSAGWVFLDYRNQINTLDQNTILYAHGRKDQTMFGSLKNILTNGWLNNSNNYIVKLSTENENTLWQVFSVYRIPTTNDYLYTQFPNINKFLKFTQKLLNRSAYHFHTTVNENDKILTLSTCYNDNDKVVLHAKLIKRQVK